MPYSLDNIFIAPWENIILLRTPQWVAWIISSFSVRWNPVRSYFECMILVTVDVILKLGTSHASRQPAILNTHITSVVLENHFLGNIIRSFLFEGHWEAPSCVKSYLGSSKTWKVLQAVLHNPFMWQTIKFMKMSPNGNIFSVTGHFLRGSHRSPDVIRSTVEPTGDKSFMQPIMTYFTDILGYKLEENSIQNDNSVKTCIKMSSEKYLRLCIRSNRLTFRGNECSWLRITNHFFIIEWTTCVIILL